VLLELHTDDPSRFAHARQSLDGAITLSDTAPEIAPLVLDRVG
jgi:hypothetical protein